MPPLAHTQAWAHTVSIMALIRIIVSIARILLRNLKAAKSRISWAYRNSLPSRANSSRKRSPRLRTHSRMLRLGLIIRRGIGWPPPTHRSATSTSTESHTKQSYQKAWRIQCQQSKRCQRLPTKLRFTRFEGRSLIIVWTPQSKISRYINAFWPSVKMRVS